MLRLRPRAPASTTTFAKASVVKESFGWQSRARGTGRQGSKRNVPPFRGAWGQTQREESTCGGWGVEEVKVKVGLCVPIIINLNIEKINSL